jgi:hypothetical protein
MTLRECAAQPAVRPADLSSRLGAWLDAHLVELSDGAAIAVHLDSLGALPAVGDPLDAALVALAALAARLAELGDPGRAGLVLPLRATTPGPAAGAPPTRAALAAQLHPMEPPSLCVVAWGGPAPRDVEQEGRAPLAYTLAPPDGALPAGCTLHAYYHEHKLERAVHVDAYPPTLA